MKSLGWGAAVFGAILNSTRRGRECVSNGSEEIHIVFSNGAKACFPDIRPCCSSISRNDSRRQGKGGFSVIDPPPPLCISFSCTYKTSLL